MKHLEILIGYLAFHLKMVTMILQEILLVEIKNFNALIDNKPFFDQPVKNKQEAYEKLIEMPRNDDYTTGNLLDFSYHQYHYELIGIDLSRQTNTNIPQQINFTGRR